jgi:hypothetical protein
VDADAVDLGEELGVALGTPGADHLDLIARLGQRAAFLPHPAVERDGEVLDEDQDAGTAACLAATS